MDGPCTEIAVQAEQSAFNLLIRDIGATANRLTEVYDMENHLESICTRAAAGIRMYRNLQWTGDGNSTGQTGLLTVKSADGGQTQK